MIKHRSHNPHSRNSEPHEQKVESEANQVMEPLLKENQVHSDTDGSKQVSLRNSHGNGGAEAKQMFHNLYDQLVDQKQETTTYDQEIQDPS